MEYLEFVQKAVLQDKRNLFSTYDGNLECVPEKLRDFYKNSNPVDVEINFVRFVPASELSSVQAEYAYLSAQFVFATCNGDPIFLHNDCVYTVPHGVKEPKWEFLSKDIATYLSLLFAE